MPQKSFPSLSIFFTELIKTTQPARNMQDETSAAVSFCPSFSSYSCHRLTEAAAAAAAAVESVTPATDSDDDFEFPTVTITVSDEAEQGRQLVFPVFNRDMFYGEADPAATDLRSLSELFLDDRDPRSSFSSSSSEADDLEGAPEGSYCVWTPKSVSPSSVIGASPSPGRCVKSNSTGSSSVSSSSKRRWRLRDLLRRSSSDGKAVSHLLMNPNGGSSSNIISDNNEEMNSGKRMDEKAKKLPAAGKQASAHEVFYTKSRALKEGDKRRSYLPYRQDLVGFFSTANGFTNRTLTPF